MNLEVNYLSYKVYTLNSIYSMALQGTEEQITALISVDCNIDLLADQFDLLEIDIINLTKQMTKTIKVEDELMMRLREKLGKL